MSVNNYEMRLENFLDRKLITSPKATINYNIKNQKILLPNKGIEKFTFCIVIIEYNGVKHYSEFAYDKKDMLYFKENNIDLKDVIGKMINIVLDTTNISPNVLETDNLSDFVKEFDKFTKKLIK